MATSNSPPSVNVAKYFGVNRKWSKETILADHKDLQASAMGVSHHDSGQFAVLGGRRYGFEKILLHRFYVKSILHKFGLSKSAISTTFKDFEY